MSSGWLRRLAAHDSKHRGPNFRLGLVGDGSAQYLALVAVVALLVVYKSLDIATAALAVAR